MTSLPCCARNFAALRAMSGCWGHARTQQSGQQRPVVYRRARLGQSTTEFSGTFTGPVGRGQGQPSENL